jgi:hypothetical protein
LTLSLADERAGLGYDRISSYRVLHPVTLEGWGTTPLVTSAGAASASLLTRHHRTDDLPIARRMLGVGPDGSRRIQKDRLDDQTDDQGASERESIVL